MLLLSTLLAGMTHISLANSGVCEAGMNKEQKSQGLLGDVSEE